MPSAPQSSPRPPRPAQAREPLTALAPRDQLLLVDALPRGGLNQALDALGRYRVPGRGDIPYGLGQRRQPGEALRYPAGGFGVATAREVVERKAKYLPADFLEEYRQHMFSISQTKAGLPLRARELAKLTREVRDAKSALSQEDQLKVDHLLNHQGSEDPPVGEPDFRLMHVVDFIRDRHQQARLLLGMDAIDPDGRTVQQWHPTQNPKAFPIGSVLRPSQDAGPPGVAKLHGSEPESWYTKPPVQVDDNEGSLTGEAGRIIGVPKAEESFVDFVRMGLSVQRQRQDAVDLERWREKIWEQVRAGNMTEQNARQLWEMQREGIQGVVGQNAAERFVDQKINQAIERANEAARALTGTPAGVVFNPVSGVLAGAVHAVASARNFMALSRPSQGIDRAIVDPAMRPAVEISANGGDWSWPQYLQATVRGTRQRQAAETMTTILGVNPKLSGDVEQADYRVGNLAITPNSLGNQLSVYGTVGQVVQDVAAKGHRPAFMVKAGPEFEARLAQYRAAMGAVETDGGQTDFKRRFDADRLGITLDEMNRRIAESIFGSDAVVDPPSTDGLNETQVRNLYRQRMEKDQFFPVGGDLEMVAGEDIRRYLYLRWPGERITLASRFPKAWSLVHQFQEPNWRQRNWVVRDVIGSSWSSAFIPAGLAADVALMSFGAPPMMTGAGTMLGMTVAMAQNRTLARYVVHRTALMGARSVMVPYNAAMVASGNPEDQIDELTLLNLFGGDQEMMELVRDGPLAWSIGAQMTVDPSVTPGVYYGRPEQGEGAFEAWMKAWLREETLAGNMGVWFVETAAKIWDSEQAGGDTARVVAEQFGPARTLLRAQDYFSGGPYVTSKGQPITEVFGKKRETPTKGAVAPPGHRIAPQDLTTMTMFESERYWDILAGLVSEQAQKQYHYNKPVEVVTVEIEGQQRPVSRILEYHERSMDQRTGVGGLLEQPTVQEFVGWQSGENATKRGIREGFRDRFPRAPSENRTAVSPGMFSTTVYDEISTIAVQEARKAKLAGEGKQLPSIEDFGDVKRLDEEHREKLAEILNRWSQKVGRSMPGKPLEYDESLERSTFGLGAAQEWVKQYNLEVNKP